MAHAPAPAHIPYLDGWRGLAIVFVLIGHFSHNPMFGWLGPFGVALFFALSGRLMGELLFVKQVPLADFFARRATRVLPTFWLFCITLALATWPDWQLEELLSLLVFLRTYFPADANMFTSAMPIAHIWSLNVEEHTYVWLAACAVLARVWRLPKHWLLCGTMALLLALIAYYQAYPPQTATGWRYHTQVAALGIVAAAALRCLPQWRARGLALLALPACALAALCFAKYEYRGLHLWLAPLCLAFAVNYLHALPGLLLRALATPWLRWFGRCSFSLYLWQQPFFAGVAKGTLHPAPGLLAALAAGALSFYVFEDPLRRYLNRKWTQRASRPAPAAAEGAVSEAG